ncbi:MAG TPA: MarR family winged helix-turn-helix transcriptional regulator [Acidimicrobiales bacterium]|nr:MarR family winged helix-turn-helix transcriptional regulator [Acidimicrobiales bacterium]
MMIEVSSNPSTVTSARPSRDGATHQAPSVGTYGRVAAWLSKRVEVALAQMDLTLPQYRVLGVLAEESAAASALADRLAVRPPSMSALIDGLVTRGLVDRRQEDADRRRNTLRLTDEGTRIVQEADRAVDDCLTSIAGCLPSKDESMALRALELWGDALTTFHQARKPGAA